MAEEPKDTADPIAIIAELSRVVTEHQAMISALVAYLQGQPDFDVTRLLALLEARRAQLKLPPRPNTAVDAFQQLLHAKVPGWIQ